MDWLSDQNLLYTFFTVHGETEFERNLANDVTSDYEMLMSSMLGISKACLKNVHYNKKVKQCKDNGESLCLREQGNKLFLSSKNDPQTLGKVLEIYTKSLAFAVLGSEEMSLSFTNRSTVLLKLKRWQECLYDIERALTSNCPEKVKSKLFARMGDCYLKLAEENCIDSKFWLNKAPKKTMIPLLDILQDYPLKKKSDQVVNEENVIPQLKRRNEKYSGVCDAVDAKYSEELGRHFVATRDINVGEVLIVEKPYMQYLSQENQYTHCSYCMTFVMTGIPCDNCVQTVYCSQSCKKNAWVEFHQRECTIFDLLKQYDLDSGTYDYSNNVFSEGAYLRLLLIMYHEAGGLQQLKDRVTAMFGSEIGTPQWDVENEYYPPGSLESILCLTSRDRMMNNSDWPITITSILRILFLLLTSSDFFDRQLDSSAICDVEIVSLMINDPDVLFIGKLLVKLKNRLEAAKTSTEYQPASIASDRKSQKLRGITLSSFDDLIVHSCFPNTFVQSKRNHAVRYSIHSIKKGEKISLCHDQLFMFMPKIERQRLLQMNCGITCNCVACAQDWPPLPVDFDNKDYIQRKLAKGMSARLEQVWKSYLQMRNKITNERSLEGKEEMVEEMCRGIEIMCEEYGANSLDTIIVSSGLIMIYAMTGNTCPLQSSFFKK